MSAPPTPPSPTPADTPKLKRCNAESPISTASSTSSEHEVKPARAGKGPLGTKAMELSEDHSSEDLDSDEFTHPDLAEYFAEFPVLSYAQQIRICRAYASFLTAQLPPKAKRSRKK